MDNICDYDEAYTKQDAEDIGWCSNCKIKSCTKNKYKAISKEFIDFANKHKDKVKPIIEHINTLYKE